MKQPWYTSKVLWTLVLAFVFNLLQYAGVISATASTQFYVDSAMLFLGLVFRWNADQQLTFRSSGPDVKKL